MGDEGICSMCHGKRTVDVRRDKAAYETVMCWRCRGTGLWVRREDVRRG